MSNQYKEGVDVVMAIPGCRSSRRDGIFMRQRTSRLLITSPFPSPLSIALDSSGFTAAPPSPLEDYSDASKERPFFLGERGPTFFQSGSLANR